MGEGRSREVLINSKEPFVPPTANVFIITHKQLNGNRICIYVIQIFSHCLEETKKVVNREVSSG